MAFSRCVHTILCTLSTAALAALDKVVDAQMIQLQLAVTVAQAKILKYDILLIPVQAANTIAQAALDQLKSAANLVPSDLINGCVDFGNITLEMQRAVDQIAGPLNDITQDLTRLLSFREELNALVEEYNKIITKLNEFRVAIAECAVEVAQREQQ